MNVAEISHEFSNSNEQDRHHVKEIMARGNKAP